MFLQLYRPFDDHRNHQLRTTKGLCAERHKTKITGTLQHVLKIQCCFVEIKQDFMFTVPILIILYPVRVLSPVRSPQSLVCSPYFILTDFFISLVAIGDIMVKARLATLPDKFLGIKTEVTKVVLADSWKGRTFSANICSYKMAYFV